MIVDSTSLKSYKSKSNLKLWLKESFSCWIVSINLSGKAPHRVNFTCVLKVQSTVTALFAIQTVAKFLKYICMPSGSITSNFHSIGCSSHLYVTDHLLRPNYTMLIVIVIGIYYDIWINCTQIPLIRV